MTISPLQARKLRNLRAASELGCGLCALQLAGRVPLTEAQKALVGKMEK